MKREGLRTARESSTAYHKIHKRLVGPASADRLLQHYLELTQTQSVERFYEAGWAATEASLVAKDRPLRDRIGMIAAASSAWQYAEELASERAREHDYPDYVRSLRIQTALGFLPLFSAVIDGDFTPANRKKAYESLLVLSDKTIGLAEEALDNSQPVASNYRGLAHEQNTMKSINHLFSDHLLGAPSLARSDNGTHYPRNTHDVQVMHFWGRRPDVVKPLEVKSKVEPRRYDHGVVVAKRHLGGASIQAARRLHDAFLTEYTEPNILSDPERALIGTATTNVLTIANKQLDQR